MERKGFLKRFVGPVLSVFIVMGLSWAAYMLAPRLPSFTLFQIVAVVSGITLFAGLWLGALYVYYVSYVRGAGLAERIVAALVNPAIWMTKEVVVVGSIYAAGEALYYYLNPIHLLLLGAAVAEMGIGDILARKKLKAAGSVRRVFTVPAAVAVVLGISWIAVMFLWDLGVHHFYIFQEGFKALFGFGSGL
jgi:hypothetical protein